MNGSPASSVGCQTETFQDFLEGLAVEAERAGRSRHVAAMPFEGSRQEGAVEFIDGALPGFHIGYFGHGSFNRPDRTSSLANVGRQVAKLDLFALRQHD